MPQLKVILLSILFLSAFISASKFENESRKYSISIYENKHHSLSTMVSATLNVTFHTSHSASVGIDFTYGYLTEPVKLKGWTGNSYGLTGTFLNAHGANSEGEFEAAFIIEHNEYEYLAGMISILDHAGQETIQRPVTGYRI